MNQVSDKMSDLIYVFLDGEASEFEREALFSELAENPSLQSEFQQAIELNQSFRQDKAGLAIPAALTNKVFTNLGFTAAGGSAGVAGASIFSKLAAKFGLITNYAVSSLVSLCVGAGSYFVYNNYFSEKVAQVATPNSLNYSIINEIAKKNAEEQALKNIADNNLKSDKKQEVKIIYKEKIVPVYINVDSTKNEKSNNQSLASNNIIEPRQNIIPISQAQINAPRFAVSRPSNSNIFKNNLNISPDFESLTNNPLNLALEVRGIAGLADFPNRSLSPEKSSTLNNTAFRLMYKYSKNNSFGFEYGKESLQLYEVKRDADSTNYNLKQNVEFYSLMYRHNFDNWRLFDALDPIGEFSLGASKYGGVLKVMTGFQFFGSKLLTQTVGIESSMFLYQNNSKIKSMQKIGLTYSLGINF